MTRKIGRNFKKRKARRLNRRLNVGVTGKKEEIDDVGRGVAEDDET